jgi:hypothetical protein
MLSEVGAMQHFRGGDVPISLVEELRAKYLEVWRAKWNAAKKATSAATVDQYASQPHNQVNIKPRNSSVTVHKLFPRKTGRTLHRHMGRKHSCHRNAHSRNETKNATRLSRVSTILKKPQICRSNHRII